MSTDIELYQESPLITSSDIEDVNKLLAQQISKGTQRVYKSDFKIFHDWCVQRDIDSQDAPPGAIAVFLAHEFNAGTHPSTLNRRLSAIRYAYKTLNKPSPTESDIVRGTLKGIKRDPTAQPTKHKTPLTNNILINIMQYVPYSTMRGLRDRAILLILFSGAFRRSEIIDVQYKDVHFVEIGVDIKLYKSKTNQEGKEQMKSIAKGSIFCPITALKEWIETANINEGYLFRSMTRTNRVTNKRMSETTIYNMVKLYTQLAGYDFDIFSPHSLRAGFITSAIEKGKNLHKIMDVTLHSTVVSLQPYVRFAERYKDHPGEGLL